MSAYELPPLPTATRGSLVGDWVPVYTADQMRDYAQGAINLHEQRRAEAQERATAFSADQIRQYQEQSK